MVGLVWVFFVPVVSAQAPPADSVSYRLVGSSRFDVETRRAGLFGFAGHNHLVRAGVFEGAIVDVPGDRSRSRVHLVVLADSLRVLTGASASDLPKITDAMRGKVLQVARFPTITFASTAVEPAPGGVRVRGDLTLAGQTRPEVMDVTLVVVGDTIRASGRFSVSQRAFGIAPYRAALGTVQVADQITFDFAAVGVREASLDPASGGQHLPSRSNRND